MVANKTEVPLVFDMDMPVAFGTFVQSTEAYASVVSGELIDVLERPPDDAFS